MRKILAPLVATVAASALLLSAAGPAMAAVSYAPDTGGFAGKGDVMTALEIASNAELNRVAGDIAFLYEAEITYTQVFEREQVTGKEVKTVTSTRSVTVSVPSAAVLESVRKNKNDNVTGFNLGAVGASLPAPPTSLENPGEGQDWEPAGPVVPGDLTGGLYVKLGTAPKVPLPNTPVL